MTSAQIETPIRHGERLCRTRGERSASPTSRSRRAGMVSEAVVARYIRDLAEHGRRVHGVAVRPQVVTR
jgi:hypothetical protein